MKYKNNNTYGMVALYRELRSMLDAKGMQHERQCQCSINLLYMSLKILHSVEN